MSEIKRLLYCGELVTVDKGPWCLLPSSDRTDWHHNLCIYSVAKCIIRSLKVCTSVGISNAVGAAHLKNLLTPGISFLCRVCLNTLMLANGRNPYLLWYFTMNLMRNADSPGHNKRKILYLVENSSLVLCRTPSICVKPASVQWFLNF